MALDGVRGDVTQQKVAGLLQERQSDILDTTDPTQVGRFEDRVAGAAVEVVLVIGTNPPAGPLRDLAAEAIALQTAAEIEYSEYPEQQAAGDVGRGYHLHQRYLELLARLRDYVLGGGGDGSTPAVGGLAPTGDFPPAERYPDPARGGWPCVW